ncbi:hypothetical protein [Nesterenkonia halobia]
MEHTIGGPGVERQTRRAGIVEQSCDLRHAGGSEREEEHLWHRSI